MKDRNPDPDTELLASELHLVWLDAFKEGLLSLDQVWYRVAARAKELRP